MKNPYTKKEIKDFIKETRQMLRTIESDLLASDWWQVYESVYCITGSGELLVEKYEHWEQE
jgi:predicted transcriptional regulator